MNQILFYTGRDEELSDNPAKFTGCLASGRRIIIKAKAIKPKVMRPKITLKNYWDNNDRFADLFDQVFKGKKFLIPDKLSELDIDESLMVKKKDGTEEPVERYRDVIKSYNGDTDLVILGIENQSYADLMMPVRNMLYDSLNYVHQCKGYKEGSSTSRDSDEYLSGIKKGDKIRPVICLVLYYGEHHDWDGPEKLSDMMDIPVDMHPYFNDYKINIINMRSFDISGFKNEDNKNFFTISQYMYAKGKNFNLDDFYKAFPDVKLKPDIVKAIGAATGSNKLINIIKPDEGEEINMCVALETLEQQGYERGKAEMCVALETLEQQGYERGKAEMCEALRTLESNGSVLSAKIIKYYLNGLSKDEIALELDIDSDYASNVIDNFESV